MAKRNDDDKHQVYDPPGERGDTGKTAPLGRGTRAEKGGQRRHTPVHAGPTRPGAQGTDSPHGKRSGSDSNSSR
ncbi:MAG TPA: hypothetical protein VH482_05780 [Thermomicrobiales bacterium]|jgi:hypothetical protein